MSMMSLCLVWQITAVTLFILSRESFKGETFSLSENRERAVSVLYKMS